MRKKIARDQAAKPKVRKAKGRSIKRKILLCMSATVLISLLVTGTVSVIMNYTSTNSLLEDNMAEMAELAAQRMEMELQSYINVAYDTGSIARLADEERDAASKKEIVDQRANSHNFVGGNILNRNYISIFDGNDYSEREYAQQAMAGNTYVSVPLLSKVTGEYGCAPVGGRDPQHQRGGRGLLQAQGDFLE